jgi:Glutathione-dependent formaldehyde-activating enzyme
MQAAFKADQVQVVGRFSDFARISDEADRKEHLFHFCPACGSQVFYTEPIEPDLIVVSVGASPTRPSRRRRSRATSRDGIHGSVCLNRSNATTRELKPGLRSSLSTRLASTARRPTAGASCSRRIPIPACSSTSSAARALAGRKADAIEHLRQAIDMWEGCRDMAKQDSDFDPIRDEPAFQDLVGR